MGPRAIRLLHIYWERLQMVSWMGCYYGEPFHGERCLTQRGPLSPTISNVVVDTVVHHWDSLVAGATGGDNSEDNETGQPK